MSMIKFSGKALAVFLLLAIGCAELPLIGHSGFGVVYASSADSTHSMGQATIDYKRRKPKVDDYRRATTKAKINALENHIAFNQVRLDLYNRCLRSSIGDEIDSFISNYDARDPVVNKNSRQLKQTVQVVVNDSQLNIRLNRCKGSGEKSRIAFVFLARQKLDQRQFEPPVSNSVVENSLKAVFLENRFTVTTNHDLESNAREIYRRSRLEAQYLKNKRIDWQPALLAVDMTDNDYFAFGTMEIRLVTKDRVNGLFRASVSAYAELMDIATDSTLATYGDIQESALGETQDEAITKARKLASKKIAERLVSQLNAQAIH